MPFGVVLLSLVLWVIGLAVAEDVLDAQGRSTRLVEALQSLTLGCVLLLMALLVVRAPLMMTVLR